MLNIRKISLFFVSLFIVSVPGIIQAQSGTINGHKYVDLGLPSGTKWATCNIGADSPEEYGDYYSWGETRTKKFFYVDTYKLYYKKVNESISGNRSYDVARKKWGENWRIPTKSNFEELDSLCIWNWTTRNGVAGYDIKATNGNSIFLPAGGARVNESIYGRAEEGYYWSSTPNTVDPNTSYFLFFNCYYAIMYYYFRAVGLAIRPVTE